MEPKVNKPSDDNVKKEAVDRAARAGRYAVMFPHLIRPGDERFQDVNWQEDNLRRIYKLTPLQREIVNKEGEKVIINTPEEVNRKAYMREYMAKKRAQKRGEIEVEK